DGRVKILDFGLAQMKVPVDEDAETATLTPEGTVPGTIIGTLGYMSPEQLKGEPADARSDIFALGCVLYEMFGGKAPFLRDSTAETSAAILKEEPAPLSASGAALPAELDRTVRRCLEKSPMARFQSSSDLAYNLRSITTDHAVPMVTATAVTPVRRRRRAMWIGAGTAALFVAGLFGWTTLRPSEQDLPPLKTVPLTSFPGEEIHPAISPDGSMVAFVRAGETGTLDLYVKLIGEGNPLLLSDTASHAWSPSWSPDGRRIAFYSAILNEDGESSFAVESVPALGGPRRQLLTTAEAGPGEGLSWSPDGSTLAIVDREVPDDPIAIFLLSLETGGKRRLTTPPADHIGDVCPQFSPDGRTVAFVRHSTELESSVFLVPAEGGEPRLLVTGNVFTSGVDWTSDGREIIFSANRPGSPGYFALWRVRVEGGEPQLLPVGEGGVYPSLSRQRAVMTYQKLSGRGDIWRIGGPSADGEYREPSRLISSSTHNSLPRYSPDGSLIAFGSRRSGFEELWICNSDGSNPTQLTHMDGGAGAASWSPDGQQVTFTSMEGENWDLWAVSPTGGIPRRLTDGDAREASSTWSRDGRWIYFTSNRSSSSYELYRMPAGDGDAIQLTTAGGFFGVESTDGQTLYFTKRSFWEGPYGIWRIPVEGGEEVEIHDRGEGSSWEVLESGICYLNLQSDIPTVEFLDFASGEVRQVAEVQGASMWGFAVSPDGRWVLYQRQERESDIMLVENFR
ncbi:MAG: protein kinase, partial [Thermoanaerobaculales bacterium]|nr:protein kinase [Thermoanaerobaculales bacterium]